MVLHKCEYPCEWQSHDVVIKVLCFEGKWDTCQSTQCRSMMCSSYFQMGWQGIKGNSEKEIANMVKCY
jgi:hypothetical protein